MESKQFKCETEPEDFLIIESGETYINLTVFNDIENDTQIGSVNLSKERTKELINYLKSIVK